MNPDEATASAASPDQIIGARQDMPTAEEIKAERKRAEVSPDDNAAPEYEELSLAAEFWLFLKENKAWWLVPMILMVLLLGAVLLMGSGPAAPFIYTLF